MTRDQIFTIINSERKYQDLKWDGNEDTIISAHLLWMQYHLQKARELASTTSEKVGSNSAADIMAEVRKVVALGVALAEVAGMPERRDLTVAW